MKSADRRNLTIVALIGAALGVVCALARMAQPIGIIDFQLFWYVGHGHIRDAYDPLLMTRPEAVAWAHDRHSLPYPYPPPMFLLLKPIALLPWRASFLVWSAAQVALFAVLTYRMLGWLCLLTLFSIPVIVSARIGQTGLLMSDLVLAGFLLIERRPIVAGVLLGAAGCLKPQSALAAPVAVWRSPRTYIGMALAAVALSAGSLLFGLSSWTRWLGALPGFAAVHAQGLVPELAPSILFSSAWAKLVLGAVGILFAIAEGGLVGCVVGTALMAPYLQLHDLANFCVVGAMYLKRLLSTKALRDLPMAAVGLFLMIAPTHAAVLTCGCAAIILSHVVERRAFSLELGRA